MLNVGLLVLVQVDLEETSAIKTEADPLADNFCWVHEVVEDSTVNGHQRTAAGSLLFLLVNFPRRLGEDSPLGNEDDMLARELLLQLTDQPGLNLLEGLQLRNRHKDDN